MSHLSHTDKTDKAPKPAHLSHPKYRADIDGIRAIAVLLVVGFHAFPTRVKGGLIGVDIFFVISGFLISTIIFKNLEHDRFSFIEFYSRRIRRIFPALVLVLVACLTLGWFALLDDELTQLGKHIAGGAGFISNFVLLNESGYFDNDANTKPLLHLWSLGIEEQFYIIWPLLLWAAWKRKVNFLIITCVIAISSLLLNVTTIRNDAIAAFYTPQTRFWELLAGSILAYTTLHFKKYAPNLSLAKASVLKNILSFCGAGLITAGLLTISKESLFPGWLALLPTTGTVLLIAAGSRAWLNRAILSRGLLVGIGLISYPLYLWHWPLLSFSRIIQSGQPAREFRIGVVLLSIVLSWLTWKFIERPLRFGRHSRMKTIALLVAMIFAGTSGFICFYKSGLESRAVVKINPHKRTGWGGGISKHFLINECGITNPDDKKLFAVCRQDSRQTPRFALLGDSKAAAFDDGLFRTSSPEGRWLFIGGNGPKGAPVPVLSDKGIYRQYQELTRVAIETINNQENIETVALVMAARALFRISNSSSIAGLPDSKHYNTALEGLTNATKALIKGGKKIVLVVDNPTLPDPKDCMERKTSSDLLNKIILDKPNEQCLIEINHHLQLSKKYRDLLDAVAAGDPKNIQVFDTLQYLCDSKEGVCRSHKDGHILYSYSDHISDYAAGVIGENLNKFLLKSSK